MKSLIKILSPQRFKVIVFSALFSLLTITNIQAQDIKGQAVLATVTATAKVTKINQKTREVTLKTDDGQEYSFVAGDQVKNLAQVKKGDVITAVYTQAIAYEINPSKSTGVEVAGAAAVAQPGTKPAGVAGQKITITVKVIALDAVEPSVTFKGPQGNTRKVRVSDPQELVGVKIGDTVDLIYTEAVAIKVEKASKK